MREKNKGRKKELLASVQAFIPVKDIRGGVIETTDYRFIRILEIEPINFMLRSAEEQNSIISTFAGWLKISPIRLQFKSLTRKADSDHHIAMIRKDLEKREKREMPGGRGGLYPTDQRYRKSGSADKAVLSHI